MTRVQWGPQLFYKSVPDERNGVGWMLYVKGTDFGSFHFYNVLLYRQASKPKGKLYLAIILRFQNLSSVVAHLQYVSSHLINGFDPQKRPPWHQHRLKSRSLFEVAATKFAFVVVVLLVGWLELFSQKHLLADASSSRALTASELRMRPLSATTKAISVHPTHQKAV